MYTIYMCQSVSVSECHTHSVVSQSRCNSVFFPKRFTSFETAIPTPVYTCDVVDSECAAIVNVYSSYYNIYIYIYIYYRL